MTRNQEPKYQAVVDPKDGDTRLVNRASREQIPDDEPVFIFRARDVHAQATLEHYLKLCNAGDSTEVDPPHLEIIQKRIQDFEKFATENPERMKWPDTAPELVGSEKAEPKRVRLLDNYDHPDSGVYFRAGQLLERCSTGKYAPPGAVGGQKCVGSYEQIREVSNVLEW